MGASPENGSVDVHSLNLSDPCIATSAEEGVQQDPVETCRSPYSSTSFQCTSTSNTLYHIVLSDSGN